MLNIYHDLIIDNDNIMFILQVIFVKLIIIDLIGN